MATYREFPRTDPDPRQTPEQPAPDPPSPPPPKPITTQHERRFNVSSTVLDQVIPMAYGTCTVTGQIGAWEYDATAKTLDIGVIFAYGEQNSIATSTTYINGEAITSATGITNEAVHTGDGSTALSSVLTGMTNWTAADTTLWQGYAHAAMTINCRTCQIPSNFVFTSKLGGRKCTPIAGGAAAVSSNPAVVAYDIMTSSDWAGVATTKIDEDSFEAFESWCDDTMSDSSERYSFNGAIYERDPWRALEIVLGHGLAEPYITAGGTMGVWAEMAPASITGDWSASSSVTITEDATSGAATTELAAGDYVYVGTNLRRVSSVTDDDTVVLDSAVTVTSVKVRPTSNVYIKKHDWVMPPAASEMNLLQTPDEYRIRFVDEDNAGSHEVLAQYGSGTDKIVESSLIGCTTAAVATRIATTYLNVAHLQPWFWSGVVGNEIGTLLEPGDVLLFDDDLLTMQAARVLPPIQARADGTYVIQLREYDASAYHEGTDTTDTPPSLGTAWATNAPPIVTTITTQYAGTEYDGITWDGSGRQVYGDSGANTTVTGSQVRLPNNVPLYGLTTGGSTVGMLKMNTSDELELGDGSYDIYLNSPDLRLASGGQVMGGHGATPYQLIGWTEGTPNVAAFGSTNARTTFSADTSNGFIMTGGKIQYALTGSGHIPNQFKGLFSGTAATPSTSILDTNNDWCFYWNTSSLNMGCFWRIAGTIYRVS